MLIVIPAYRPSNELPLLVTNLLRNEPTHDVLVVDDGSGPTHDDVFARTAAAGATVLRTPSNHGKGTALKTAFRHLIAIGATGPIVTADADGQHAPHDIIAVGSAVDTRADAKLHIVLGERGFDTSTPARSRIGNVTTRLLFRLGTGVRLHDTQTGLRAFPSSLLPWLVELPGEHYEFELIELLQAVRAGIELRSVTVTTIYNDGNASSHFRPLTDSLRIYTPLLVFLVSSFSAFLLDTSALLVLDALTGNLLVSVIGARVLSATVNFAVNHTVVFANNTGWRTAARAHLALATALLVENYLVLNGLTATGLPLLPAKVATEALLLTVSYAVQAGYVYGTTRTSAPTRAPAAKVAA